MIDFPYSLCITSRRIRLALGIALVALPLAAGASGNILPNAYAWSENGGWINFAPNAGPGVTVADNGISGYAWSENFGWISFAPIAGGVSNQAGTLSGYAWGENAGWINFAPVVGGGVSIDPSGQFTGWAWGENIGWINFATQSPVLTSWIPSDLIFADGFE